MITPAPIPHRLFNVGGIPMHRVPRYLRPYLDAVDGALLAGVVALPGKRATRAIWLLFRGGDQVGEINVETHGERVW